LIPIWSKLNIIHMIFQNNKKVVKAIFVFFIFTNCEIKNQNYLFDKNIAIDSIKLINAIIDKKNQHLIYKIDIFCVLNNIGTDTLIIYNNEYKKSICSVKKSMQIDKKTITFQGPSRCEINDPAPDIIAPHDKKEYTIEYFDPIDIRLGHFIYIEYELDLFYNKTDTLYSYDSTTMKILPYSFDQGLRDKNTLTIYIDLQKNNSRLVDSTFEEVLESYKRRGYIVQ